MTNKSKVSKTLQGGNSPPHAKLLRRYAKAMIGTVIVKNFMVEQKNMVDFEKGIRYSEFGDKDKISFETPEGTFLAIGVGSVQRDERHVVFLDLDGYNREDSEAIARELIGKMGVSDCYIIQSSPGNHHLVSLDLVDFKDARKVAEAYGHEAWAKFRGMSEDYVLRIGPKLRIKKGKIKPLNNTMPRLVSVVKSPFAYREKSNSLRRIFRNVWGYDIPKDAMFNDDQKFRMHIYRIRMKGKGKVIEFKGLEK